MNEQVRRYHPVIVGLHWTVGLLILLNLAGGLYLHQLPNEPGKLWLLRGHMLTGLAILVLLIVRLIARFTTAKPPVPHQSGGLRILTLANHWGLYLIALAMVSTGLGTAAATNLFPLLGGAPVTLPATFENVPPFKGHETFWIVLLVLLALHLAGVVYHRIAKRENILPRMWFGDRGRPSSTR
jgi:cytochrome b561